MFNLNNFIGIFLPKNKRTGEKPARRLRVKSRIIEHGSNISVNSKGNPAIDKVAVGVKRGDITSSSIGNFVRLSAIGANVKTVAFEFEQIVRDGGNFDANSVAINVDRIVARSDSFNDFSHVNKAVFDGRIGRLLQQARARFYRQDWSRRDSRRAKCEVLNNFGAELLKCKLFGEVEGKKCGASRFGNHLR